MRYTLLAILSVSSFAADKQLLSVTDMHLLQDVGSPHLSADGRSVVYSVTANNVADDRQVSDLWQVNVDGSQRRQLTHTAYHSEWAAQYSPDAKWIAFLSDRGADETTQIWVMAVAGGEAKQVTQHKGGLSDFVWSPDSNGFAFIASDEVPEAVKDSAGNDKPEKPWEIDRYQFKEDGNDYLFSRYQHLYRIQKDGSAQQQLTQGHHNEWLPAFSPDGSQLVYVSKRGPDPDRHINFDLYVLDLKNKTGERQLTTFIGNDNEPYWDSRPQWSPDGKKIAYLQSGEDKWIYYAPWQLTVIDANNGKTVLPTNFDRCFTKPQWSNDSRFVYALREESRVTLLTKVDTQTGKQQDLTHGDRYIYDFGVRGDQFVLLGSDATHPFQLSALRAGKETVIVDHNDWLANRQVQPYENFSFNAKDGTRIDGFVVKPPRFENGKRYPTIVRIHGGPVYQFSHEYMHEWQTLAAAGYVVVAINPRGSSGRGFDYAKAIYADWGNVDAQDVSSAVDELIKRGIADPQRLGIGGWSYGSILTNYVIARDPRFKAATSGAGTSNMFGNYGVDQYVREYENELGTPWDNFDAYARVSFPFLKVQTISTPTLFLCAEKDFNVPCNGAEQMYQALRSRNVKTRLIIYPGQNHGLSVPSYLEHRLQHYLDWYKAHLLP